MPDRDIRTLLDFIVHTRLATLEEKQAEFAARALDPADQPAAMAAQGVETDAEAANRLFPAFAGALRQAAAGRDGGRPLVLDDADPAQNAIADAVIRFLVKSHLATVETEEIGADHYRYQVTIDWLGLEQTATLAGVRLDAALAPAE